MGKKPCTYFVLCKEPILPQHPVFFIDWSILDF